MKIKSNDLFESYLHTICSSQAQFEAINRLHKLYFESQMDNEVEFEDECCDGDCNDGDCKDGECKGGKCKDGTCECEKGITESVGEDNISAEAEKNGLSVPEYMDAKEMFDSIL